MSKPVFEDLFTFSGRRNRKSYVLLLLGYSVIGGLGGAMLGTLGGGYESGQMHPVAAIILVIAMIPLTVSGLAAATQRCRDCGWTGWTVLLQLIPLVGIVFSLMLLFKPGTHGPNRYGEDPVGGGMQALPA